ncbi:MAG TPA: Uma2 family endonuclease [Chloroflexia bacterium]|nr:Uma2 family endonuclease [Chloroflexia bacterium]
MAMQQARRRFTVDEYHKMGEAGILHEDDRVELIDGEIVQMTPINIPHSMCVGLLTMTLAPQVVGKGLVWVQNPITIDDLNEPQPDVALVKPRDYLALGQHPGPDDILLLIEVADATVRFDRIEKVPRYARAGIVEVWLVNLPKSIVEVYSDPLGGRFRDIQRVGREDAITLKALPDLTVSVADFLGSL